MSKSLKKKRILFWAKMGKEVIKYYKGQQKIFQKLDFKNLWGIIFQFFKELP